MSLLKIPTSKAGAMSFLVMLVGTGYRHWTSGQVHHTKAEAFANRMHQLYGTEATTSERATLKKHGKACAMLVMYPSDLDKTKIQFWLLATAGKGAIRERESLSDALFTPLTWNYQYHLTQIQRERGKGGRISWTWQMQHSYFKNQLNATKVATDYGYVAVKSHFTLIGHMPMFSGIRDQVQLLDDYGRKTWNKRHRTEYPQILPVKLPNMPKIKVFAELTLSDLVKQMEKDENERVERAAQQAVEILGEN